ncbi:MAG: sugar-binding protein [Crocinitomicaceae bacterium]
MRIGYRFTLLLSFIAIGNCFGQDSLRIQNLNEIQVNENRVFKRMGLYDSYDLNEMANINGFTQLTIFDNTFSDEVWTSKNSTCVTIALKEEADNAFLDVKWNKDQEGCDWVGVGFGWDFWSSKDMGQIIHVASIEIEVRSKGKNIGNLPWALGFEDYAGGQAWTGFSKNFIPNGVISKDWTKIQIPLALFPFVDFDCDPSNIKQLIIQLFAQDEVEINAIRIVPFTGKLKEETTATPVQNSRPKLDGKLDDWKNSTFTKIGDGSEFSIQYTPDSLFVAVRVEDTTPNLNNKKNGDLWNGDAIEIAFATNPNANPKRKLFLLSDYHIGINCGPLPYLWNFSEDKPFDKAKFAMNPTETGYTVEIGIAIKDLMKKELAPGMNLGFEIAIDLGDESNKRMEQLRWNSSGSEGFHQNPSLWGTVIFE